MFGPPLQHYDSFSTATLPADNGHWALLVIASAEDRAARALRDPQVWERVVRSCPLVAHWLDAEPIDDTVTSMSAIEDRYRHFCRDGTPVAPGVLALGDAFACTNPSVGRGISIGTMHAVALRDLLRDADLDDAVGLSLAWDAVCEGEIGGYVRDTLFFDGHRLAEMQAQIDGRPYETEDAMWARHQALFGHTTANPELLRAVIEIMSVLGRFSDVVTRPAVADAIDDVVGEPIKPLPGPSRAELVTLFG
jgi:flavin-dependent dehydrogenase